MIIKYKIHNDENHIIINRKMDSTISKSLNKLQSDKKILFIFDKNISKDMTNQIFEQLKANGFKIYKVELKGLKNNKSEKYLFKILDFLIEKKFTKNSIMLSCGGGVIGDITALASSLYLRGLIYCHIPTTITAIVDSCIGGKTAINYKGIINSVGNYYHSRIVFIFDDIIQKMPEREYLSGIPEILKCGLIKKNNILKILKKHKKKILERNFAFFSDLCKETLKTKLYFFLNDEKEKNLRLNLNFGHTFAHAIEMSLNSKNSELLRHGEAVGLGILCEIFYSNKKINKLYLMTKNILEEYSLPVDLKNLKTKKINLQKLHKKIINDVFLDKKRINQYPRYISLKKQFMPKIKEMDDMNLLNETVYRILN
tara:strand:+ start:1081 stop:2190 length:1110 start_codon:yes stop_codon:yes gene_type:complete